MTNKNYKTQANRDGITLLFVISMVVLFLLMGTTFMLVSNDYYKSARVRADAVSYQVDSTALLDRCFYDLVRGPSLADKSSPLRGHSILADQYGYGIKAEVFGTGVAGTPTQTILPMSPFVTISLSASPTTPATSVGAPDPMRLVRNPAVTLDLATDTGAGGMVAATGSTYVDGLYAGRVISITSGALQGFSSRIISHSLVVDATPANNRMTVVVLASGLNWGALANDDQVVINGADFSGRGAGDLTAFGGTLAALEMYDPDTITAGGLGANSSLVNQQEAEFDGTAGSINANITGYLASDQSTNESYDIPDHQNLFLGGVLVDGTGMQTGIIPSFHRDAILLSQITGAAPTTVADATTRANLWRQSTLRPIYVREPGGPVDPSDSDFNATAVPGSSANYEFFERSLPEIVTDVDANGPIAANGTLNGTFIANAPAPSNLDVDSDGDGVLDSVWIDIGLPAQTDSEGRTFKPLVAYRVLDMDGRINLNTSGTSADVAAGAAAGLRGGGFGVAEISPRNFLALQDINGDGTVSAADDVDGDGTADVDDAYLTMLNNRYLSTEFSNEQNPATAIPGAERDNNDNVIATGDQLGRNQKLFGYPGGAYDVGDTTAMLNGSFATGLDLFGQLQLETVLVPGNPNPNTLPEFSIPTTTLTSAISPYQVNLGLAGSSLDNLFTPEELEGVLRAGDADGSFQPTRLRDLVLAAKRNSVTTHSFEITLPATTGSLVKKLNNLLVAAGVATPAARTTLINGLLSQQVLLGGKVDINRALGNGEDDDMPADGVVDNESITGVAETTGQFDSPTVDLSQGRTTDPRQVLAQDIYITTLLVCGENAPPTLTAAGTLTSGTAENLAYRQMIAQWAINVVDFRDPDSIMTGFEVDLSPFDAGGWEVDGDLTTSGAGTDPAVTGGNRVVVWGAERPELLITETFAYHDRRNQDLPNDDGLSGMTADDMMGNRVADGDTDWDSGQVPQSGAFFELFHPWGQVNDITRSIPAEFDVGAVDGAGNPAPTGVNLGQETPSDDPVWRLALKGARADATFARAIYFYEVDTTRTAALMDGLPGGDFFYTTLGTKTVEPGEYAVIGSSGNVGKRTGTDVFAGERYETTFGRRSGTAATVKDAEIGMTRGIALDLANDRVIRRDGSGTGMETADEDGDGDADNENGGPSGEAADLVRTIAINSPRSLSISDPTGGYTALLAAIDPLPAIASSGDGQRILPVLDTPLDSGAAASDIDAIWTNGVTDNFRFAYLQRLANPLLDFNAMTNPYLTIDTAGVDLLAFNGMTANSDNGSTSEVYLDGGVAKAVIDGGTFVKSVERGESKHAAVVNATVPKQNLFASEEGNRIVAGTNGTPVVGDSHNLSYAFTETFGGLNNSYSAITNSGAGATTPFGWLTWNNRPFANATEIANVPFHSSEWLCYYFNEGTIDGKSDTTVATNLRPIGELANDNIDGYELMAFFGNTDQGHKHLLRFGQNNEVTATFGGRTGHPPAATITAAVGTTNRMVNIFDYIEVPSKFLGSETYLAIDGSGESVNGDPSFGFEVPFHGVPNFRAPGKININTITDPDVWDAIFGYTPASPMDFTTFNTSRGTTSGPSDFGGVFTSSEGSQFVSGNSAGADSHERGSNAGGTLFQLTPGPSGGTTVPEGIFDGVSSLTAAPIKDTTGSPYFKNEFRQRLGSMTTTRSSVFSIWITVGYFDVDEFGRIGGERGSLEGQVTRNRAYYMYDRSIPMAFEPGKDHNVDNGVLVRTIIQ